MRKKLIISFFYSIFLFTLLLFILISGSADYYEYNIYKEYPIIFWILIIAAFSSIQFFILRTENRVLMLILALLNVIVISLPLLRNYFFYNPHDSLTHMGWIVDILNYNHIGNTNIYPSIHILTTSTILLTNISIQKTMLLIPIIFFILYIFTIFLYRNYFKRSIWICFFILMLIPFAKIHYNIFAPFSQSIFFSFIIIFLINKIDKEKRYIPIVIILIISLIVYHPVTTLIIILYLFVKQITLKLSKQPNHQVKNLLYFSIISFFIWSTNIYIYTRSIRNMVQFIFIGKGESSFSKGLSVVEKYDITLQDLILYNFFTQGLFVIFSLGAFFSIIYLFIRKRKIFIKTIDSQISLGFFILLTFAGLFLSLIAGSRIFFYTIFFAIIIISFTQYFSNKKKIRGYFVIFVLLIININAIFSIYYSPVIRKPNLHATENQYETMSTFFDYYNDTFSIYDMGYYSIRYYEGINGRDFSNTTYKSEMFIESDLGYDRYHSINYILNNNTYLVTFDLGRNLYNYIYPDYENQWRYDQNSFNKLNEDNHANLIFNSEEMNIFIIS